MKVPKDGRIVTLELRRPSRLRFESMKKEIILGIVVRL